MHHREEQLKDLHVGVAKYIARFMETQSLSRKEDAGRPTSITPEMQAIVEVKMHEDDKTTAYHLRTLLLSHGYSYHQQEDCSLFSS